MIFPFNQNWRTSQKPFSLSLRNTVNTGVSYSTPSGTVPNQQFWASAGFRPTYGTGLGGLHGGCGCGGNGGSNFLLYALAGAGIYFLANGMMRRSSYGQ